MVVCIYNVTKNEPRVRHKERRPFVNKKVKPFDSTLELLKVCQARAQQTSEPLVYSVVGFGHFFVFYLFTLFFMLSRQKFLPPLPLSFPPSRSQRKNWCHKWTESPAYKISFRFLFQFRVRVLGPHKLVLRSSDLQICLRITRRQKPLRKCAVSCSRRSIRSEGKFFQPRTWTMIKCLSRNLFVSTRKYMHN